MQHLFYHVNKIEEIFFLKGYPSNNHNMNVNNRTKQKWCYFGWKAIVIEIAHAHVMRVAQGST